MTSLRDRLVDRRDVLARAATALGSIGLAGCLDALGTNEESADDSSGDDSSEPADDGSSEDTGDGRSNSSDSDDEESDGDGEEVHAEYDSTEVRVETPDGEELGSVTAAIADTGELQRLGLSDTEHLPEDRGMLFVYDSVAERTFIMPEMDFGIDIVFADDEGVITEIHHAPQPGPDEDGSEHRYPGRGQYVLEVNYEWTAERGIEEGDVLAFELEG
ncbi:DUF192 domain-containing protein [Halopiger goleimassiliensis]|uniref:DUF192 domain-containing protein n=1 Tax=Halopiger goleimassiliensis TaxID=1293048 RepID=UPI000677BE70|nr:DUF192 domain-containing protein [Halopiger goleimassiliensis]